MSDRSAWMKRTLPSIPAAAALPRSASRPVMMTEAPSLAISRAHARPMPAVPPVINAVCMPIPLQVPQLRDALFDGVEIASTVDEPVRCAAVAGHGTPATSPCPSGCPGSRRFPRRCIPGRRRSTPRSGNPPAACPVAALISLSGNASRTSASAERCPAGRRAALPARSRSVMSSTGTSAGRRCLLRYVLTHRLYRIRKSHALRLVPSWNV